LSGVKLPCLGNPFFEITENHLPEIVEPLTGAKAVEAARRRGLDEVPIQIERDNALVAVCVPDNGPVERARVGGGQFEGVGPEKIAATQPDREAAFGNLAGAF
jgi:hypothetical protein